MLPKRNFMLPREAQNGPLLNPGTAPAALPSLPPEHPRKGLYIKPTIERDGFAIHPAAPDREQLVRDRVSYIGAPQPTYEGLVYAYEHNLFDGIDPKKWNATVTYYTSTRSMEDLAISAREEFGLNLASMWPMAKVFSQTMRSVKTNLLTSGFSDAEKINPDERKNMHAGIYKERQQAAVSTDQAREDRRQRMLHEPENSKRKQRASETLKRQRRDPEFLAKLVASEPTRVAKITTTWRRKAQEMREAQQTATTPVAIETHEEPIPIPQPIEPPPPIPDTPEVLAVKQLTAINNVNRQLLIAQAFGKMQAYHEQGLLAIITGGQRIEEFTPFMQGFLLMSLLAEEQGKTIHLSHEQGKNIADKLNQKDIASRLIAYAQTDKQLFAELVNLAHAQFAFPPDIDVKTIGERVKQQAQQNKQNFLYGIAVMYFLASHEEKQTTE